MATLINREVWHVGAVLTHGRIVKHSLEGNYVVINTETGFSDITVHSTQALLTIDRAIEEAEEAVDYWTRKVTELEAERNRREA